MKLIEDKGFLSAFKNVILIEGGYTNNSDDNGGKTKYGITFETAKRHNINVENITLEEAKEIYYEDFWKPYNFNLIQNKKISGELFEFTVNCGSGKIASKVLQRAFNVLNKNYILKEDGDIGHKTAKFVNNYKYFKSLYKVMNILQGMFYIALAENDENLKLNITKHVETEGNRKYKTFIRGWIDKRIF